MNVYEDAFMCKCMCECVEVPMCLSVWVYSCVRECEYMCECVNVRV